MTNPNGGLNKLARLIAARQEEAVKNAPLPLDPDFPFEPAPFPSAAFFAVPSREDKAGD